MAAAQRAMNRASLAAVRVALPRYLLPFVLSGLATLVAFQFVRVVPGDPPYALYYAAVALSAWYGGLGPGLIATLLAGLAIDYYVQEPRFSFAVTSASEALRLAAFALVVLLIGLLQARARANAERAHRGELRAQQLASIVASSDDAIVGLGLDGQVRSWNAGAERLLGHQAEQMIGRPVTTLAVDPTQAEIPTALRQLEAGGHLGHYETVWADHAGRPLAVSVTLSPVLDARGRVVGASAIARDVTRRKLAEEAHARLAAIVAASSEAIVGADADGVITSWNPGARRLFGHHASEVVGRRLAELLPADERGHWDEVVGLARGGQDTVRATLRLLHRQGYPIEAAVVVCPVRDASDAVAGLSLIGRPASAEGMSPRWQILTEAAQAWTRGEGAGQVLGALLRGAARAIDADAVSALRWDAATSELVALPTTAAPSPAAGATSPSGPAGPAPAEARFPASGAAARAIAGRAPALVNDYASATDATPEAVAAGVRAAIAVPVIHRGRVVGVLQATLRRSDRRFGPDDVAFLEMAAPLVAGCLQELAAG